MNIIHTYNMYLARTGAAGTRGDGSGGGEERWPRMDSIYAVSACACSTDDIHTVEVSNQSISLNASLLSFRRKDSTNTHAVCPPELWFVPHQIESSL